MARKKYSPEDIIQHLRTFEIERSKGLSQEEAAKKVGVTVTLFKSVSFKIVMLQLICKQMALVATLTFTN